jgi:flagellar protein FliO/FliZ
MLTGWLLRRLPSGAALWRNGRTGRLTLVDSLALSPREKLVLVRLDDREHLLFVGQDGGLLIEQHSIASSHGEGPSGDIKSDVLP